MTLAAAALLAASAAAAPDGGAVPLAPEDLGPASVDVSGYPPEHRRTYEEILLPLAAFLQGGAARLLNSPLIEIDARGEAVLRREHPGLFEDPRLAEAGPDVWRREVTRIKNRPPCCGACPVLSREQARALWRFLAYDSLRRKTGERAEAWAAHRRALLRRFEELARRTAS